MHLTPLRCSSVESAIRPSLALLSERMNTQTCAFIMSTLVDVLVFQLPDSLILPSTPCFRVQPK